MSAPKPRSVETTLPEMPIAGVVRDMPEAQSIYINQIVYDLRRAGHDPVVLSLGEAFFDIPLFDFAKIDVEKGYHYSDSLGLPELRYKIAGFYNSRYGTSVSGRDDLLITAGSKAAIFMAMRTAANAGEEVVIHEPCWLSYPYQAKLAGIVPRLIPYDVAPAEFERYLTPATRMLVINNPNNPAGRLYTADELHAIYQICRRNGVYVLVDEAYSDFVLDRPFTSMAEVVPDKDGVIIVNSLSKNMGMSGWRIGYVIAAPRFIRELLKVNQHIITCAPTVLLQYCAKYFDDILDATLPQVREVAQKRARVAVMLDELRLECLSGDSTFYFFMSISDFPGTADEFAMYLLLKKFISVVPGSAYGDTTGRFVRISIGTESDERIWEALQVIKTTTQLNRFEPIDADAEIRALRL